MSIDTRVLSLAEEIIRPLDNGAIFDKYLQIKSRIIGPVPPEDKLSEMLKKIALENRELNQQLDNKSQVKYISDLNDFVINELTSIQNEILPNITPPLTNSVEEACGHTYDVYVAKIESISRNCQKLTAENNENRRKSLKLKTMIDRKIEKISQKCQNYNQEVHEKNNLSESRIEEIEKTCKSYQQQISATLEENKNVEASINSKESAAKKLFKRLTAAEKKKTETVQHRDEYRNLAAKYKKEVDALVRKIEATRAEQRFGVQNATQEEMEEIRQLEAEIEVLMDRKAALAIEAKKLRYATSEVSDMSVRSSFLL